MKNRVLFQSIALFIFLSLATKSFSQTAFAYITNLASNNVSVINTSTNAVVATVAVGTGPRGVAVSNDGSKVYVANNTTNNVSVINTATNTVTATIAVGTGPFGTAITPDGSKLYTTNFSSGNVSVINTSTSAIVTTVTVGSQPFGIAVSPDGTKVYVANRASNNVSVINTATNTVTATIAVGTYPNGVTVSPDGSKVYVANWTSNNVSVINAATNSVAATVTVGTNPQGIAISPDGSKVYVANYSSNNVSVMNTATNTVTATITAGSGPRGVALTPDGSKLFIGNSSSNNVTVVNTATNTTAATVAAGSTPFPLGNFISPFASALPVHFLQVTASQKANSAVEISWKAAEDGIERYEVESTTNGSQFDARASLLSNHSSTYTWTDNSPNSGINYYRIKAVGTSGEITYSKVLNVTLGGKKSEIAFYPNPVEDQTLAIQFLNKPAGKYLLEFRNSAGQSIYQTTVNHTGGSGLKTVSLPAVAKGLYQVSINNGKVNESLFLLIK